MDSFESAYRRHFASVFRFAMSVTGRHDVAEDLTAEAFLELHRHADAIALDQLPAWLFVVVRNRARDLWRRRGDLVRNRADCGGHGRRGEEGEGIFGEPV